jgi:hypothetical protein
MEHNTITPTATPKRCAFFCSPADERAMATIRRLLYPKAPWTTRSEVVRAALQLTAKALAEKAEQDREGIIAAFRSEAV